MTTQKRRRHTRKELGQQLRPNAKRGVLVPVIATRIIMCRREESYWLLIGSDGYMEALGKHKRRIRTIGDATMAVKAFGIAAERAFDWSRH